MPLKTIEKVCTICGVVFSASLKEHKRGNAKTCSKVCAYTSSGRARTAATDMRPNCKCAFCDAPIRKTPSKMLNSKSGLVFCNRLCKEAAQSFKSDNYIREIMPAHYKNGDYTPYRVFALKNLPHQCSRCGYDKYLSLLEVHHINRNRKDNSLDNLVILCVRCHAEDHYEHGDGAYTKIKAPSKSTKSP